MKKAYSNQNLALVGAMRSYLEENNIAAEMRNEFAAGVMGDVPVIEVWPELWVRDDDFTRAAALLAAMQQSDGGGPDWSCRQCREPNPASFEVCWQCGQEHHRGQTIAK